MTVTDKEEDAPMTEVVEKDKKIYFQCWWNDEDKTLMMKFEQVTFDGKISKSRQIRRFLEDGTLYYHMALTHLATNVETWYEEWLSKV